MQPTLRLGVTVTWTGTVKIKFRVMIKFVPSHWYRTSIMMSDGRGRCSGCHGCYRSVTNSVTIKFSLRLGVSLGPGLRDRWPEGLAAALRGPDRDHDPGVETRMLRISRAATGSGRRRLRSRVSDSDRELESTGPAAAAVAAAGKPHCRSTLGPTCPCAPAA